MVPTEGVEPTHPYEYQILSLARLPIPPRRPNDLGKLSSTLPECKQLFPPHKTASVNLLVQIFGILPIPVSVILGMLKGTVTRLP